jgi:hypothetical protein
VVWKKIEPRRTAPTSSQVTPSITPVAETKVLMRQVCGGTNGCRTRRSMNPNAASSTAETVSTPSVFGDVQAG